MIDDFRCADATTLGALLDDRLPPDLQAELTAHLEDCADCRAAFDKLAAGSRWWGDLRRYVRPDPPTGEFPPAADGPDQEERLEFLAPPTGPGHIGRFGPYEVLGLLGRGGMGVVLKAFDPALHRLVAVKVLAPQLAGSATARERFAREARAVAAIAHDHIVAIHAVDSWDGLPYLVMQYVPGRSLQERVDAHGPLGVKEVLRIGIQAASGLAAAHARGVIHRDIKPSNILLENGVERVKITDFGLARVADDASLTQSGLLAGTPQYMAPEQARGEPVDPRADLFSLGSVLYAACTGRSPFRAETTMGVLRRVCDDPPRPIREVNPDVPDWLAAVIHRLLAKDPADRYATAEEVAALLEPFLAHVQHPSRFPLPPFPDRPAPAPPRRRWAAAAALAAALVLGGLGIAQATGIADVGALVATILRIKTRDGTLVVEVEDPDVTVSVDDANGEVTITGAGSHEVRLRSGRHQVQATKDGKPVLDELITITRGGKEVVRVRREPPAPATPVGPVPLPSPGPVGEPAKVVEQTPVPARPPRPIWSIDVSPDGRRVVAGESDGVRVYDLASRREVAHGDAPGMTVGWVAFSPDGTLIASAEHGNGKNYALLRDAETARVLRTLRGHEAGTNCVAFSPDGKTLASSSWDRTIKLWDVATGAEKRTLRGHSDQVTVVAYSPDGKTLASSSLDTTVRLWDAATGEPFASLGGHGKAIQRLTFSPDGKVLATSGYDLTIKLWDVAETRELATLTGHDAPVVALAFSPDGKTLASAASLWGLKYGYAPNPSEIRLWDVARRETRAVLTGHTSHVFSVRFTPDGTTLVSGGMDTTLRLWDVATGKERGRLAARPPGLLDHVPERKPVATLGDLNAEVWSAAFSPDGQTLVWGGKSRDILGSSPPGVPSRVLNDEVGATWAVAFAPDGSTYATAGYYTQSAVKVWDARSHQLLFDLKGHAGQVRSLHYSPDGTTLASGGSDRTVRLWNLAARTERATLPPEQAMPINDVRFFPDGAAVAIATGDWQAPEKPGSVVIWDLVSASLRVVAALPSEVKTVAVSADGATVVSGGADGLRAWDAKTGAPRPAPRTSDFSVHALEFSPDGRYLATGHFDGVVVLWEAASFRPVATFNGHRGLVFSVGFSPDGRTLASCGRDKTLRLWSLPAPPAGVGGR